MQKPLILVTNDDGITAPGIRMLISLMNRLGEVYVIAPDKPQSGKGHAVTIDATISCDEIKIDDGPQKERSCSGTPVDCVKLAIDQILPRRPDICVSGINHGANSSINVLYSGTMSAVVEAGIEGIPAVGFSFLDFSWGANFKPAQEYIYKITANILKEGLPSGVVLNVNIPNTPHLKGIKIARQARAKWREDYEKRKNPRGREYYWLAGKFINLDQGDDTDEFALNGNYISIVPVQFDLTAHHFISELKKRNF